jgi:GH24 family phage-related lysozyme (muramidase)
MTKLMLSTAMTPVLAGFEGTVLNAYLDLAGVVTIGAGFTNRSAVFKAYWLKSRGHALRLGDKITMDEIWFLLPKLVDEEYGAAVNASIAPKKQHHYDGAASAVYNLGKASVGWKWALALAAGDVKGAAKSLRNGYNTVKGRKVDGLTRRRKIEADIIEYGGYPTGTGVAPDGVKRVSLETAPSRPDPVVEEAQRILTEKGFNPGAIDGWMGEKTKAAIIAYQQAHPNLDADGILGMATLTQLRRDAVAVKEVIADTVTKGGGSSFGLALMAHLGGLPWQGIIPAVLLGAAAWFAWQHRDVFARRWNSFTGRTVVA